MKTINIDLLVNRFKEKYQDSSTQLKGTILLFALTASFAVYDSIVNISRMFVDSDSSSFVGREYRSNENNAEESDWQAFTKLVRLNHKQWHPESEDLIDFRNKTIAIASNTASISSMAADLKKGNQSDISNEIVKREQMLSNETPYEVVELTSYDTRVRKSSVPAKVAKEHLNELLEMPKYEYYISYYSNIRGLRPELISAVVYAESYFDSTAVSSDGAMGLMQLIPHTGGLDAMRISGRGNRKPTHEELFDPKVNIDLGTAYFKHLIKRYDFVENQKAKEYLALAAYNWGMGNVKSKLSLTADMSARNVLVQLEMVAPKQTQDYINRIRQREESFLAKKG